MVSLVITYGLLYSFPVLLTLLCALYWIQTRNFDYWKKRGVPYVKPHWFFGNLGDQILQRKTCTDFARNLYNKFKGNGFGGLFVFSKAAIFICDPIMIETVLTKDFAFFEDRSTAANPDEVLSDNLLNATGEKWRKMRHKLVPTFSSAKVKGMFDQVLKCAEDFCKELQHTSKYNKETVIEPMAFTFTTEVIASCAFGVQLMTSSSEAKRFRECVEIVFSSNPTRLAKMWLGIVWPGLFSVFKINFIPNSVKTFFATLTKETIKYRINNNIERDDFLQLILALKEQEDRDRDPNDLEKEDKGFFKNLLVGNGRFHKKDKCFTENSIASLMFNLLSSGVKPAACTITYALLELANNPDIQRVLREEVCSCIEKHGGFNYSAVKEMTYLDQVVQEVHRLYPFSKCLSRVVNDSYKLPGTDLTLEKGTVVYIPVSAIHTDPNYYPSPHLFDPDRFSGNNFKPSVSFMPYGNGPRICIGIRFAVLMMKVCIARVVYSYNINLEMQLPIKWNKHIFNLEPKDGVRLSFQKRED